MNPLPALSIGEFQKHIAERYSQVDRQRGSAATFLLFMEEVGELATAIHNQEPNNLREEFADVFAWLCTLANINDVDLTQAVTEKYLGKDRPQGHK